MINNVLKKGADDLDDDFVYDESLVEVSGEDDFEGQIDFNDEDDELKNNNLKRKLDDGEKHSNQSSLTKNEKQRLRKKQKKLLKEPVKYDFCVPQKKSDILSEYWKKFKILKKNKYKLSTLELEDLEVQKWDEELFVDTSEICFERNTLNIWNGICHGM
ncbi:hypothetical protein HDU92_000244 [Lobulomyces angularis]|nr:hypothetical protein HDU92_000244 [Lobulomyces angularis]